MNIRWLALTILLLFAAASCTPSEAEPLSSNPQETLAEELSPTSTEDPLQSNNTPESIEMPSNPPPVEKFVSLAKKDLAERLKIAMDEIALVKTAEMTWPNAALGCPSPGKVYAQGKVPGFQISLAADNIEYIYNTDWSGQVILCLKKGTDGSVEPVSTLGPEIGVPIK